ncbi:hypothetical protein CCM_00980 [Cordyceps militaris CM01]|uniref:Uncharacterized protein n=1 Tax=Cordyceps militaris (strain CM01) TaxID=983644 RepID=G3J7R0_CORMM|nr:uncharacterized protein CCM_00980 [Cordyceps militaris CM01]EGX96324.1 hypothetical protein CCM_00980 [Cordyceps militaris CM01]
MGGAHWKRSPVAAPDVSAFLPAQKKRLFNSVIDRPLQNGFGVSWPARNQYLPSYLQGDTTTGERGPLDAATCLILFASQGDKLLGKERSSRNAHLQITASRITGPATA